MVVAVLAQAQMDEPAAWAAMMEPMFALQAERTHGAAAIWIATDDTGLHWPWCVSWRISAKGGSLTRQVQGIGAADYGSSSGHTWFLTEY